MARTLDNGLRRLPVCPVCEQKHKCMQGDGGTFCMKVHSAHERRWRTGTVYFHPDPGATPTLSRGNQKPAPVVVSPAPADLSNPSTRNTVYRAVLDILTLSPGHIEDNVRRGIPDPAGMGYRSLDKSGRRRVEQTIAKKTGLTVEQLLTVPGFGRLDGRLYLHGYPGLVVPCLDAHGDIMALRVRTDDAFIQEMEASGKPPPPRWSYLSGGQGGAKVAPTLHFARNAKSVIEAGCVGDHCVAVTLTEGERKADAFASFASTRNEPVAVLSIPGVNAWQKAGLIDALLVLGVGKVIIAFDADHRTKPDVAGALVALVVGLREAGLNPEIATWSPDLGKGIDDLVLAGHLFEPPDTAFLSGGRLDSYLKDLCDRMSLDQEGALFRQSFDQPAPVEPATVRAGDQDDEVDPPGQQMEPFPLDILPPQLADLAEYVGKDVGVDPACIVLPALSCLAGLIGMRRQYQVAPNYVVPCALWSCIVMPSGSRKTAGLAIAKQPFEDIDDKRYVEYQERLEEWEREAREWDEATTKEGPRPKEPRPSTFLLDDHTVETIARRLDDNRNGVLLVVEELDELFEGFVRYGNGSTENKYLRLHDGSSLKVDRIKDGSSYRIKNALGSITSTVQPKTLSRLLTADRMESGMAYRFVFANPPRRLHLVKNITDQDRRKADQAKAAYASLVEQIDLLPPVPQMMKPDSRAFDLYQDHQDQCELDIHHGDQAEAGRKAKTNALRDRFALIRAICRGAFEPTTREYVQGDDVEKGIRFAAWVAGESRRMSGVLSDAKTQSEDDDIIRFLMSCPNHCAAPRTLHKKMGKKRFPKVEDAREALEGLRMQGRLERFEDKNTGGRHSTLYRPKEKPTHRDK